MKFLLASDQRHDPALLASHLAGQIGAQAAEVDVLTVIPGVEDLPDSDSATQGSVIGISEGAGEYREACAHVATIASQLKQYGIKQVRTHVEYGDPAEVILASSRLWRSQLLLVGAPRRRGLITGFRLDGVTRRLLRWADCPVALIRPDVGSTDSRELLLPLNMSSLRHFPLQQLKLLPWQEGARLHLLGVLPPSMDESRAEASPAAALLALQQGRDAMGRAEARLAALRTDLEARLPCKVAVSFDIEEGSLAELVMHRARQHTPGLIVLSAACLENQGNDGLAPAALALSLPGSVLFLQNTNSDALPEGSQGQARILKLAR
jgi:nucleotide-binding universal stress UspA family protein